MGLGVDEDSRDEDSLGELEDSALDDALEDALDEDSLDEVDSTPVLVLKNIDVRSRDEL